MVHLYLNLASAEAWLIFDIDPIASLSVLTEEECDYSVFLASLLCVCRGHASGPEQAEIPWCLLLKKDTLPEELDLLLTQEEQINAWIINRISTLGMGVEEYPATLPMEKILSVHFFLPRLL